MKMHAMCFAIVTALLPAGAAAEVVDSAANGFTLRAVLTIQAAPDEVYRRLIHNVGVWWDSGHTFSGDAHNLTMEEKPMGCFCERLPNQGSVRHMEIVRLAPGKTVVLSGGLGPLQTMAATGNMTIQFSPAGESTKLEVTYAVTGYFAKGMNTWAEPVDMVLLQQFTRLKEYVERGAHGLKAPAAPK